MSAAVERAITTLTDHGYQAVMARSAAQFARLVITARDGYQFEIDFGVDWRAHEPVWLEVGPVLALEDAIATKVGALYSRGAARDYFDVDAIRRSGRFSDDELLQLVAEHDPGFDPVMSAEQRGRVVNPSRRRRGRPLIGRSADRGYERTRAVTHRSTGADQCDNCHNGPRHFAYRCGVRSGESETRRTLFGAALRTLQ